MVGAVSLLFLWMSSFSEPVTSHSHSLTFFKPIFKVSEGVFHHVETNAVAIYGEDDKERLLVRKWNIWKKFGSDLVRYSKYSLQVEDVERMHVQSSLSCKRKPDLRTKKYLLRFCNACYDVFKEAEVYLQCRYVHIILCFSIQ